MSGVRLPPLLLILKFNSMSNDTQSTSYWDNKGKYQTEYNEAWKQLVPASGEAEDGLPEALRSISRIGYDYYNNGFCNLWQTGWDDDPDITMDPYYEDMVEYVGYHVSSRKLYNDFTNWLRTTKGYCNWSDGANVMDQIIDDIMTQILDENLIKIGQA